MCQSRIGFKRILRECKQNEEIIRANEHAKSFMEKDMTSFWKDIKNNYNRLLVSRTYHAPPPKTIEGGFIFFRIGV